MSQTNPPSPETAATPAHDPHLAHHFATARQQYESGKEGMWLFLSTEILLFSGLFCAYAVYRSNHPDIFYYGHQFLSVKWGGINTVVLITSSFTMAWAVRAAQLGQQRALKICLMLTLLCACGFLGIKSIEYHEKWEHGLLWARKFKPVHEPVMAASKPAKIIASKPTSATSAATTPVSASEKTMIPPPAVPPQGLAAHLKARGEEEPFGGQPQLAAVFFSIYFIMTGLHGLHVLGGMIAIIWIFLRARRNEFGPEYFAPVDNVGLYWHLVDMIWIYLFPLLYLIH